MISAAPNDSGGEIELSTLLVDLGPTGTLVLLAVGACLLLKAIGKPGRAGLSKALRRAVKALLRYLRVTVWASRLRMPVRLALRLQPQRWRAMCEARRLVGLKRGRVRATEAGVAVRVRLGGSLDMATLQARVDQLETGLGVKRRTIRIEATDRADAAVLNIVLRNPLQRSIRYAGHRPGTVTAPAEVATTPHGDRISVDLLRRWLIAGTTGSGKSLFARLMLAAVATSTDGRLTYCDPKQVEAAQWRHLATVATTPEAIGREITAFRRRMDDRLSAMAAGNVTTHTPTASAPAEVLFVDEATDVVRSLTEEQLGDLAAIAEQGRAPKFVLWLALQDSRGDNLPRGITTQLQAVACLKLRDATEAAVVFGRTARRDGWTPERLPGGGGWVLIRDDEHPEPEPARGDLLDEPALARLSRPTGTRPDAINWSKPQQRVNVSEACEAASEAPTPTEAQNTRDAVRRALADAPPAGYTVALLQQVTGRGRSQIYAALNQLQDEGAAVRVAHSRYATSPKTKGVSRV